MMEAVSAYFANKDRMLWYCGKRLFPFVYATSSAGDVAETAEVRLAIQVRSLYLLYDSILRKD